MENQLEMEYRPMNNGKSKTVHQKEVLEMVRMLRAESKPWETIREEIKRAGYVRGDGKPYSAPDLNAMLLRAYPDMRTVKEYTKDMGNGRGNGHARTAGSSKAASTSIGEARVELSIIESIVAADLSPGDKLRAVARLTKHWV